MVRDELKVTFLRAKMSTSQGRAGLGAAGLKMAHPGRGASSQPCEP